jgi:hypothetical protein
MARRGTGLRARTLAAAEMVIVRSKASKQAGHVQTGLIAPQNDGPIELVADTGHDSLAESEWYRSSPCRGKFLEPGVQLRLVAETQTGTAICQDQHSAYLLRNSRASCRNK